MKTIWKFLLAIVPKGQNENSPAFQRRDRAVVRTSPEGTAEASDVAQATKIITPRRMPFCDTAEYHSALRRLTLAFTAMCMLVGFNASAQSNIYSANVGSHFVKIDANGNVVQDPAEIPSTIPARPEALKFPPLNYQPPAPDQFRVQLKSGPVAYVVPDKELPLVNIVVYVHVGDYVDPEGKEGLASLTGYLLARGGAGTNSADKLEERLAFLAANLGSDISDTQGTVTLNLLSKDLDEGLGILRDVLFNPSFQDDKIALRKQQILQGMEQRNDDTREIESREASVLAYGEHFWENRFSTKASIDSITKRDLEVFHFKWFRPKNFVVAVSGDFDREEMIAKLEKLFAGGPLPNIDLNGLDVAPPDKAPPIPTNTDFAPEGAYLVNKPGVNQGRVEMILPGITRDNPDYFPVMVMNDILGGGGFTSRIMNRVRTEEGLAYDAHTIFPGGVYYPLTFTVGYQSKSRTVSYAASLAEEEIKKMKASPVSDLELRTSKNGFIDRFPRSFATKAQVASMYAQEEFTGRYAKDPEFWKEFRSRIAAVTKDDVQRVAQKYLDLDKLVVLAVGDKNDILLGFPSHPVKFQDLAGGHYTELPLRDPMTMKPLPLAGDGKN
jgi:zinc protease